MKKSTSAVIVAAGNATRMNGIDKIMLEIEKHPIIYYTVSAFQNAETIDEIVIVTRPDLIEPIKKVVSCFSKVARVVEGGSCRVLSAQSGFSAISPTGKFIAVHDGARPLITPFDIDKAVSQAYTCGACCCGRTVTDTIKTVDKDGFVLNTPDRSTLFAVATPQVFSVEIYKKAVNNALKEPQKYTDDASMVEAVGVKVKTVLCENNPKITTSDDIATATILIQNRQQGV